MNKNYQVKKRKFHDIWAIFAYLFTTGLIVSLKFIMGPPSKQAMNSNYVVVNPSIAEILPFAGVFVGCLFFLYFSLYFMPKVIMHLSFIITPVLSIIIAVLVNNIVTYILCGISVALSLFFYFFVFRKNIKYSAVIAKAVVSIIMSNFGALAFGICASFSLYLVLILVTNSLMEPFGGDALHTSIAGCVLVLYYYWSFFIIYYLLAVLGASVVGIHLLNCESNVNKLKEALKNTLYALGSICFGALLIAIVKTLEFIVNSNREDNRRNNGSGVSAILMIIASIFLAILGDVIKFMNAWAYTYIALYGDSYVEAVKNSFRTYTNGKNKMLLNSLIITTVVNLFSLIGTLLTALVFYLQILKPIIINSNQKFPIGKIIGYFEHIIMLFMLYGFIASIIPTSSKAFLYVHEVDPEAIRNKCPKAYTAIQEQMKRV